MKWKNSILLFILCIFSFGACAPKEMKKYEESKFLFGTYIKIVSYAESAGLAKKGMQAAFEEVERIDKRYNSKTEGSLIYQLNHSPNHEIELDAEGIFLLHEVKKAYELSHKKYDVTISPLMELWGFEDEGKAKVPSQKEIEATQPSIDFDKVKIEGNKVKLLSPVKEIDTGSFLKGYALKKAREAMQKQGIQSAFISSISSIELLGTKPEGKPWRVALENPQDQREMLGVLTLSDKAIGVSGDYQTFLEINGKKYHHILDKTTGYPVPDKKMVVVLCKDGLEADIYSTTFFLMPTEELLNYANSQNDLDVLIVDKDMKFHMSSNFEKYFSKK